MFIPLRPTAESNQALSNLEPDSYDKMVKDCVQACITLGQNRNPIKKADLNKLVFQGKGIKIPGAILQVANKELNKVFGMRLYELDDKTKYLLVSSKPSLNGVVDSSSMSDSTCEELAVLYFILMDIFVSADERLSEEDIQGTLKPLDLSKNSIKDLLDLYVKRLYLVQDKRQELRLYSWGPRAYAEVEPENFFNRFLNLAGDTSAKDWPDIERRINKLKTMENR